MSTLSPCRLKNEHAGLYIAGVTQNGSTKQTGKHPDGLRIIVSTE